jgi:hypothetical protein
MCSTDSLSTKWKFFRRLQCKGEERRMFKLVIGNESLPKIGSDNGDRAVNFATSKNLMSSVQCSHITEFINTLVLMLIERHSLINHILIDRR